MDLSAAPKPTLGAECYRISSSEEMDVPTALEAIYPMWRKKFKSVRDKERKRQKGSEFRKRRGF